MYSMSTERQLKDRLRHIAFLAKAVGITKLTLSRTDDDRAFDGLCYLGANVTEKRPKRKNAKHLKIARLRLEGVSIELQKEFKPEVEVAS